MFCSIAFNDFLVTSLGQPFRTTNTSQKGSLWNLHLHTLSSKQTIYTPSSLQLTTPPQTLPHPSQYHISSPRLIPAPRQHHLLKALLSWSQAHTPRHHKTRISPPTLLPIYNHQTTHTTPSHDSSYKPEIYLDNSKRCRSRMIKERGRS
jgi:hypothetical protein